MSHIALQRVMVRMLYDPEFASTVLADPSRALADVTLTAEEQGWLLGPDPRAWRVDSERPARSLASLLQRYPTSAALAVRSSGGVERLLRFFGSSRFHQSIQSRGSMAIAFGDFLADLVESGEIADRRVLPLARLEQAIAELHRTASPHPPVRGADAAEYVLTPDMLRHSSPAGTADLHEAVHQRLVDPQIERVNAIVDTSGALPSDDVDFTREEKLLLELVRGEGPRVKHVVGTSRITGDLDALLAYATRPRDRRELEAETIRLGAGADDAPDVIDGLIEDGVLIPFARRQPRGRPRPE